MSKEATLQNLLVQHFDDYCDHHLVDTHRRKIIGHLMKCHTEALGGLEYECDQCHEHVPVYHSCRDRHCPQCQQRATRQWVQDRERDQLPVSYYHLVFTLPHELNGWIRLHPTELYNLLFSSVWKTLSHFSENHKKLQGRLGMIAVLHTWGQNLSQHVHLHCLIPAGALTSDQQWHPATSYYLFPVKALSGYFRGAFVTGLRTLHEDQQLSRIEANTINPMLDQLMEHNWVVYAKSTINHTETIIRYLARYSHRIAISDYRLQQIDDDKITFDVKDYQTEKHQSLTLSCEEFIRRFRPTGMSEVSVM